MRAALALVLLVGCTSYRAPLSPLRDQGAYVSALRAAWTAAGREEPACPVLGPGRVYVADVPDAQATCGSVYDGPGVRRLACVTVSVDLLPAIVGDPGRTNVYVEAGHPRRDALVLHELAHVWRGCWASEDVAARWRAGGADPECEPWTLADHGHCDRDLWTEIERDATRRLEL
jgi:hypothetical protein